MVHEILERASAALQKFRLFSLTHRRIRGDLISMFKITRGLLEFPMEPIFSHPTRTLLRGQAYKFHQQRGLFAVVNTLSAIRLPHIGINYRLT